LHSGRNKTLKCRPARGRHLSVALRAV